MQFKEDQIQSIAPKPAAFKAGQKISKSDKWESYGKSDRVIWGIIKGSGATPYYCQIDIQNVAYKCSCPSRQFPCKHGLGLMLLSINDNTEILSEPQWVQDWIDKRRKKPESKEINSEESESDLLEREKAKIKRSEDRKKLVSKGVEELSIWLNDIIKVGLLELQNKPRVFFDNMAARMIDAQASGLASWVRSLGGIDFSNPDKSFNNAVIIIGKMNLLLASWRNFDQLTPLWQESIKNLLGWNQSQKDLLLNKEATSLKDEWIVLGQETEVMEDLTIQRSWLYGAQHGKCCLILQFGTKFSGLEKSVIPGSIIEADVLFFPAVHEQRGIIKMQLKVLEEFQSKINFLEDFKSLLNQKIKYQKLNPWLNNQAYVLGQVRILKYAEEWILLDNTQRYFKIDPTFTEEKCIHWLLITGDSWVDIGLVIKGESILPLGIFTDHEYLML